jgi:cysteine desulfurase
MIYLDNSATTKPSKEVIADVTWCLENVWGNPSSIHTPGIESKRLLEQSREKVAKFINAEPEEIIFTSSGSESNNLAIKGFLEANNMYDCIITTQIEHPSVYNTCLHLFENSWYKIGFAPVDSTGKVKINRFKQLISELSYFNYCFVSIMLANNEIGSINNIKKIAEIVHHHGGIVHCDATATIGQIPVDIKELGCDLLTFSGHKLNCPKGIGVLYKKKGINLSPIIHGGHQEGNLRAGTENLPYIYALGNQVERMSKKEFPNGEIRDYLYKKGCEKCKELNIEVKLNGDLINRLPNNLSLTFEGVNAEALIALLDMRGVCVSAGSACSSGNPEPSRVLKAIGLSDEEAFSTIRISIGADTTTEECDEFVRILGECLVSLKMLGGE